MFSSSRNVSAVAEVASFSVSRRYSSSCGSSATLRRFRTSTSSRALSTSESRNVAAVFPAPPQIQQSTVLPLFLCSRVSSVLVTREPSGLLPWQVPQTVPPTSPLPAHVQHVTSFPKVGFLRTSLIRPLPLHLSHVSVVLRRSLIFARRLKRRLTASACAFSNASRARCSVDAASTLISSSESSTRQSPLVGIGSILNPKSKRSATLSG